MKKEKSPLIEWEFHEGESDWNSDGITTPLALTQPRHWVRRWWLTSALVVLLLCALTGWLWYQAQLGLARVDDELKMAVKSDLSSPKRADPLATYSMISNQTIIQNSKQGAKQETKAAKSAPEVTETRIVGLGDDWAVVEVTIKIGDSAYHQNRVYRRTERGWYPESPTAALWGKAHTLETTYFIFHYYEDDTAAVNGAATQLDTLYPAIATVYLPAQSPAAKREIWVSPQESSQQTAAATLSDDKKLEVLSPSVNLTPATMEAGDLLAESVILRVLDQFSEEIIQRAIPNQRDTSQAEVQLRALLQSVQLWQAWNGDLPLAGLRKPIVQWIYSGSTPNQRTLPSFDARLCDLHHLWKEAPVILQAPLFCGQTEPGDPYQLWRYLYTSPWRLSDRSIFASSTPSEPSRDLAATIGLATVVEFAAKSYGQEQIATLLVNTPNSSSWATLIPTTFGVSLADFETGWQKFLVDQYGVTLHSR